MIPRVKNVGEVPFIELKKKGIKIIAFDKDGTLTPHRKLEIYEKVKEGMLEQGMPEIFPEVAITTDHEDRDHVDEFAQMFKEELGFKEVFAVSVGHGYPKKPKLAMALAVKEHFGVEYREIAVIGDKVVKDYRFAKRMGAGVMILCHEIGEEDYLLKRWRRLGEDALIRVANLQEINYYANGNGNGNGNGKH